MRTLFLIRHAQGSLGTDDYDRLSATGLQQAGILRQHLQYVHKGQCDILRGDLRRHRQTAEAIADSAPIKIDADLNEYRVDGLLAAAFADPERLDIRAPGREALADPKAYLDTFLALFPEVLAAWQERRLECLLNGQWQAFHARVRSAAQRLQANMQTAETVLAVTSAGVISTMVADLLGHDLAWQRKLNVALYNASITELALDDHGQWQLKRLNCIAHLPQTELRTLA
ncbi:MAG: histidine phosphatase family protein [Pseudomonadota bacterium]